MRKVRFAIFAALLAAGVALAVGTLVAQSGAPAPQVAPAPRPAPDARGRVLMLDGRGSQIGVMVDDLTAADLKSLSGVMSGIRIREVDADSPAAKSGLKEGDVVVEFDGERIRSARQFSRLVEETPGGRPVKLTIVRSGQRQTVDVTPEDHAFGWSVDGDRIGREIARGMREIGPRLREIEPRFREMEPRLRELEPRLREFRFDGPGFDFNFDDMLPGARSRLGVQIESLTPQLAEYFGAKDGGVLVSSVTKDSPAEKAGLKAGDVITSVNGDRVRDYDDLINELRDKSGEITLGVVRDKKDTTVKATIDQRESRPRRPFRPA